MDKTRIEWADATWNPVRGCSKVSPGCTNCYAMAMAARFSGPGQPFEGLAERTAKGPRWTNVAKLYPHMLEVPLRWRKPRRIFVNSMSDLFHETLTNEEIAAVFGVMAACPQHTFQILTKRPERMVEWFAWVASFEIQTPFPQPADDYCLMKASDIGHIAFDTDADYERPWPLPNVWLGVSVENQAAADERIPLLLQTPAEVRFISCEPLLGAVDLRTVMLNDGDGVGLDWVICGGESGDDARPMHPEWARSLRDQCQAARVPFFFKQWGEWAPHRDGEATPAEWGCLDISGHFSGLTTTWNGRENDPRDKHEVSMCCYGRNLAGRELDGRTWDEFPA